MSRRTPGAIATALLCVTLVGTAQLTLARFHDKAHLDGQFTTARIEPPTGLAGTGGASATLTWTPSVTGWATGYDVLRSATSGSGYANVGTVTPISATSTTDSPAVGTWYYVLRATFHNWSSARSNEASVVIAAPTVTTAYQDCANTAAVTANAGDNNGYESNPGRACALDGSVAADVSTGTDTTDSCTSNAKDKHDFWGYALGLPASVTSIDGIAIRPTAGMNNNGGTTRLCVQLSWNGGASWTSPQSADLTATALTRYAIGGAGDRWGRSWTPAELAGGTFRLRVIDTSTQPNKTVNLDAIQVSVTYTP
jgi:hypothetical protein